MLLSHSHSPPALDSTGDRKSTRLNSRHTVISYAVFCLKKKNAQHLARAARGARERAALYEEERRGRSLAQQLARTSGLLVTELDPAADAYATRRPAALCSLRQ